mgnify:CR=1 FL=1
MNREVNVLLENRESHSAYVLAQIVSYLSQHSIRGREFRELVEPYFRSRTDHFIHELYIFARSVYDIAGFDQHAVYGPNPNLATVVQELSSSSEDSDIEILETVSGQENKSYKADKLNNSRIKNNIKSESKYDEPIAGPSGISSSKLLKLDASESSQNDIEILDFVKPEPEIVVLSSSDDSSTEEYSDSLIRKSRKIKVAPRKMKKSIHTLTIPDEENTGSSSDVIKSKCSVRKKKKWMAGDSNCSKGKKKQQKHLKNRKSRSLSVDSIINISSSSSSSGESTSSSTSRSEGSNDSRVNRKRKTSQKKNKKKLKTSKKLSRKRKKYNSDSESDDDDDDHEDLIKEKGKRKVKSCIIIPSHESRNLSFTFSNSDPSITHPYSDDQRHHHHHHPTSYWSMGSKNYEHSSTKDKNEDSIEKKIHNTKRYRVSSNEKCRKRVRQQTFSDVTSEETD